MTWHVVDGMDGSGKSTAAAILIEELESKGRTVLSIEHPNCSTAVGRLEQAFLRKDGKLCVILSTAMYVADVLRSLTVMRGRKGRKVDDIVFVRYSMAVAYLSDSACRRANKAVRALLPHPDVAVLVDVTAATAIRRIRMRGEALEYFETEERLDAIRSRMLDLADGWVVVDNNAGIEGLREQIRSKVLGMCGSDDS